MSEIPLYNELEEREVKNKLSSFSYSHDLGLNEAPNRNPYTGFAVNKPLDNTTAFQLNNSNFNKYNYDKWEGEKKRITEILDHYSTFKKVKDFHKTLYIPIEFLGKKQILFYSRMESGNLYRVVKRPDF